MATNKIQLDCNNAIDINTNQLTSCTGCLMPQESSPGICQDQSWTYSICNKFPQATWCGPTPSPQPDKNCSIC